MLPVSIRRRNKRGCQARTPLDLPSHARFNSKSLHFATPDFLWNLMALANFIRLSLRKGVYAVVISCAAWQEIRVRYGRDDKFVAGAELSRRIVTFKLKLSPRPERSVVERCALARRSRWSTLRKGAPAALSSAAWQEIRGSGFGKCLVVGEIRIWTPRMGATYGIWIRRSRKVPLRDFSRRGMRTAAKSSGG
jgi:hypothetical protein